jgi:hypothetical protein
MHASISRSPTSQALQAELHREELLREAAAARLAREASRADRRPRRSSEPSLMTRIRAALGTISQPAQHDRPECA